MPDSEFPSGKRKRIVTRLLLRALGHYEIAANPEQSLCALRICRPVLETSAGINMVRYSVLPRN